jgi:D-aminopeptidase
MTRPRLRDLGIRIGRLPAGPHNAITDVPGVWVGQTTLRHDAPRIARTGVTVVVPREGAIWGDHAFAAYHAFNGNGEMTGIHWINEAGLLSSPIAITNTHQVGAVHEALVRYGHERRQMKHWLLPVVAETFDGWLNDAEAHHLQKEHVYQALDSARPGPVEEGCVGGGTGMICHDFKGGIGTASRLVETSSGRFTVGALVQANHGDRDLFRIDGVPVGREIGVDRVPRPWGTARPAPAATPSSSIIVILATDAPLLPIQCRRLAQRATVGLARVGSVGHNGSGDIFLAFATGNHLPANPEQPVDLKMLPHVHLNVFFEAVAEAVEESILNALCAAETTTGQQGRVAHALPLEEVKRVWEKYRGKT